MDDERIFVSAGPTWLFCCDKCGAVRGVKHLAKCERWDNGNAFVLDEHCAYPVRPATTRPHPSEGELYVTDEMVEAALKAEDAYLETATEKDWGKLSREALRQSILAALRIAAGRSGWQDIATAPKDVEILVTGFRANGSRYREVTKWFESERNERGGFFPVIWMDEYGAPDYWQPIPPHPPEGK